MAQKQYYTTEQARFEIIVGANESGTRIIEIPADKYFWILNPWEEWDSSAGQVTDNSAAYLVRLKERKQEALNSFISGKVSERIENEYGVALNFSEVLTVDKIMKRVLNSGLTLMEIILITQSVYVETAPVYNALKAQIEALGSIQELEEYDIGTHYEEVIVNET